MGVMVQAKVYNQMNIMASCVLTWPQLKMGVMVQTRVYNQMNIIVSGVLTWPQLKMGVMVQARVYSQMNIMMRCVHRAPVEDGRNSAGQGVQPDWFYYKKLLISQTRLRII